MFIYKVLAAVEETKTQLEILALKAKLRFEGDIGN